MIKMKRLKIIPAILTMFVFLCSCITAFAGNIYYVIDNDTVESGFYNARNGFNSYVSGSGTTHFNDDCRRTPSANSNDYYGWYSNQAFSNNHQNSNITLGTGVYLYNTLFTDPAAKYYVEQPDGLYLMYTVNQNTAPGGWSYRTFVLNQNHSTPGWYAVRGMVVCPSGTGSGQTGADAVRYSAVTAD